MSCSRILDQFYEYSGNEREDSMPLLTHIQIWLHTLICPSCAQEIERYEVAREIMREEFFPLSPGLEDAIMARAAQEEERFEEEETYAIPGGLSTRGWIITGLIIFISLTTSFFGLDFQKIADESGVSFMLPVGITIGIVLTSYGALFIGSHLKELSERFGL